MKYLPVRQWEWGRGAAGGRGGGREKKKKKPRLTGSQYQCTFLREQFQSMR